MTSPATARLDGFTRDGLHFTVDDEGPRDGEVVVLLHGFPTDRTSWRHVAPLLHAEGLRTLAPDQRGYAEGARPSGRTAYRLDELVADVLALMDAAGVERAHVVGHDWGGTVAWLLAGNHPDRVASLTVLSTPHPAALSRALKSDGEQRRKSWYILAFQMPWLPERLLARRFTTVVQRTGMPAEDARRYAARLARPAALRGPLSWYRAARGSSLRTRQVTVATSLVWGTQDSFLGRRAAELTREHVTGDYDFVVLDDNHWLPERRAEECAAAVVARVRSRSGGVPGVRE